MNSSKVFLLFAFLGLVSYTTIPSGATAMPEKGLYKISVMYPGGEGKTFDMDYYESKHMPMVAGLLGKNLKYYEIDAGISGRTPNDKATYMAIGYFYCVDVAEYGKAIAANREAVVSDIAKYTNVQPVIQISQIRQFVASDKK